MTVHNYIQFTRVNKSMEDELVILMYATEESNGSSLLERRLQEVVQGEGDNAPPVSLLQESSLTLSFLPQSIRNFR